MDLIRILHCRENPNRWERNWFFAATVSVVLLNVILFAALGSWQLKIDYNRHWNDCLFFKNLLQTFLTSFAHLNWQHTLLNMLCFLICGAYLERKLGSVKLFALVVVFAFFGGCAVAANNNSINFIGYSGINYALYAYVAVDYLFCALPKNRRNKPDLIIGGVMLGLIYFAMCFNGGTAHVGFDWYPHDLLFNLGHYTSYFVGILISVYLCATKYIAVKRQTAAQSA